MLRGSAVRVLGDVLLTSQGYFAKVYWLAEPYPEVPEAAPRDLSHTPYTRVCWATRLGVDWVCVAEARRSASYRRSVSRRVQSASFPRCIAPLARVLDVRIINSRLRAPRLPVCSTWDRGSRCGLRGRVVCASARIRTVVTCVFGRSSCCGHAVTATRIFEATVHAGVNSTEDWFACSYSAFDSRRGALRWSILERRGS